MANYYASTVVCPNIPFTDMTPIEELLLTAVFGSEHTEDGLYLFAEISLNEMPSLDIEEVRAALLESPDCRTADYVREELAKLDDDAEDFDPESEVPWEFALQDIVRRSPTLCHFEVTTSFTCSKMRPDGFGGAITVIAPEGIASASTEEMGCELLNRLEFGDIGCAPGHGSHVLLRLEEADVLLKLDEIFASERDDDMAREDVTDADVRAACLAVTAETSLHALETEATLDAALDARAIATARKTTAS